MTLRSLTAGLLVATLLAAGCSKSLITTTPKTIEPASAALSPPAETPPAGEVLPLGGNPQAAVIDAASGSLVVFTPGGDANITVFGRSEKPRNVRLGGPATAVVADGRGSAYAATRGGYFAVDLGAGIATRTTVEGQQDTDFTAIAHRSDGRLVLGSSDGKALTLTANNTVSGRADVFAHVDGLVTQGDTAVVLDRAQTSVTQLTPDGAPALALRAGLGATTIAADPMGRVLVADTRGGQLLVFGVDPLIERQAYPVGGAPYGVAGSKTLVWVSLTASNTVVGYDLATGIPVEKVRYPTVQQPNSLAFDDNTGTLYVVSASGAGVQVIRNAGGMP
jgi:DNA-binding beta-propeller fold protein YncE